MSGSVYQMSGDIYLGSASLVFANQSKYQICRPGFPYLEAVNTRRPESGKKREGTIRGNNQTIDCIESTSMYKSHVYEQKKRKPNNPVKDCESGHDVNGDCKCMEK